MQNILFFMPNIERGGIEKNLIILGNYFLKKNYKIEIICFKISSEIKKKLNRKIKIVQSKKFISIPFLPKRILNSINVFIYFLFFYLPKKNQVILSMQDHPFSILASKLKKIPCVIRIANHPHGSLKYYNNFCNFYFKINIKKIFYFLSSGIICNSKSSTNYFKKIYKKKRIINIYNPIKIDFSKKNKKTNSNDIISVGRLQNQKNFHGLIKAFKIVLQRFPEKKLIIIGSGNEERNLKNLAKEIRIFNKIQFIRFQNAEKKIKSSKVFVLNSLWEGLPNILIETQMLKTPIISSNCESGPNEILINGKLGYLTPVDNEKKLAKKIIYVFENYHEAKHKAKLALRYLKRFDLNTQCKKYEFFLKKFC